MNIIVLSGRRGSRRSRYFDLARPATLAAAALIVLGTLGTAFAIGMQLGQRNGDGSGESRRWMRILAEQKSEITALEARMQGSVDAMAGRLGALDAHLLRIDALGKRLTTLAHVDRREFNFDEPAAVSAGPAAPAGVAASAAASADGAAGAGAGAGAAASADGALPAGAAASAELPDLATALSQLEQRMDLRDAQLSVLENAFLARSITEAARPRGRPVQEGAISSYFGERSDPITGEEGFHKGVDFAGPSGEPVQAVAAGVVTWAGERAGYGVLVEINHGNGYVTRYAHNQRTLVSVGQTVTRGQQIALMGSTGHSTGPHVHFEVLRNGEAVNPLSFIGPAAGGALGQVAQR